MMEMMHGTGQEAIPPLPTRAEPPHFPAPVLNSEPNALGIRGLNENLSEWGFILGKAQGNTKIRQSEYVILGGLKAGQKQGPILPSPLPRKPWEAFEEVSFRTAQSITGGR